MKKLTLAEAKADAEAQALWVWRQENWKREIADREYRRYHHWHEDDADYELELTGYQEVGAAGDYFEVPNR